MNQVSANNIPGVIDLIQSDVLVRLLENKSNFPKHPTCQHSMYILEEEFQELRDEFKKKDCTWDYSDIYDEVLDVIASCYRLLLDNDILKKAHIIDGGKPNEVLS